MKKTMDATIGFRVEVEGSGISAWGSGRWASLG